LVGDNLADRVGALAKKLWGGRRVAVITQAVVERNHGARLRASLARAGVGATWLRMPTGEENKSLDTVAKLYDRLLRDGFSRDDAILAFGGGTVGDTAGFVAATFLRGIPYAQVPTTLLAQIDSSIGAKVGVNHPRGKNLVGAMYRPSAVLIDNTLLATLPRRELRSGSFELLKYGFIGAPRLLSRFEREPFEVGSKAMARAIGDGVRRKLDVVRLDESEQGLRRILNFGHTVGHGLEAASGYTLLKHGEAVGWGMIAAVRLAAKRGALGANLANRLESAIDRVGPLPKLAKLSRARVLAAVREDKKRSHRGLRFILPIGWGRVTTVDNFPESEISWVLASLGVTH
jgi:3-dehydroquinate synthase